MDREVIEQKIEIAVHNYVAIDWEITHAIATRHVNDFAEFAAAVVAATGI